MTKDEALRIALDAFNNLAAWNDGEVGSHMDEPYAAEVAREAITAIKAALEAKDEPVAFRLKSETVDYQVTCYSKEQADIYINDMGWQLIEVLYTTPPQRKPLTDEEIRNLWDGHVIPVFGKNGINPIVFARAIEAAHGIKGEA